MLISFLLLVHLVPTVLFSLPEYQCSLTNPMRCRNDRQMVPSKTLRGNSLVPSKTPFLSLLL